MANDESPSPELTGADLVPPFSAGSAPAPWTGRRMYASGRPGAGRGGHNDEIETGRSRGVSETAVWGTFLNRILKAKTSRRGHA